MEESIIYRSYRQGGRRYEKAVGPDGDPFILDFKENLYIEANPLWAQLVPDARFQPLKAEEIFGNSNPFSVEIGIGNGEFIAHHASKDRNHNWLGFEVFHKIFYKAVSRCRRLEVENVRLLQFDAEFFVRMLPLESVTAFYVNFPDPWPKAKHTKRRLLKPWFMELLASRLVPDGTLTVATDHEDYAREITENFSQVDTLQSTLGTPYVNTLGDYYKTKYYRKFAEHGTVYFYHMKRS